MLSGIRSGKKKRKTKQDTETVLTKQQQKNHSQGDGSIEGNLANPQNDNASAAARLKAALASGATSEKLEAIKTFSGPLGHLEKRGRIHSSETSTDDNIQNDDGNLQTIVTGAMSTTTKKSEEDMTIQELAAKEKESKMSWDEQMTRNLARVGKKKRRFRGDDSDSDEEVRRLQGLLQNEKNDKSRQRNLHVMINQHHQQEKVTSNCSWWLESSSFSRHRLLALGNHVSLVMAPPSFSLVPGHHFYFVPLKHAKSFVDCDDDEFTWEEVRRFHDSLQKMYAKKGKGVIMMETVLPNKGFWQTKIEAVPVPFAILQDAPIFFKSAMAEQTETWGTHNKLFPTTLQKPLKSVVPKNFPYFSVFWGDIATSPNTGLAQIIEASDFRHDFGLDTLAGMMELEPIRFQRKKKFSFEIEKESISDFLSGWERVDWTLELDGGK